jgi:hypothetical protein
MPHEPGQKPSATRPIFERDITRTTPIVFDSGDPVLTLRGSTGSAGTAFLPSVEGLKYRDGIVHCACFGGRYTAVNVMDPDNPYVVGSVLDPAAVGPLQFALNGVTEIVLKDQYAMLAAFGFGFLTTVDFSDLTNPQIVNKLTLQPPTVTKLFHLRGLASHGNVAYGSCDIGSNFGNFHTFNISDPAHPSIMDSIAETVSLGPLQQAWHLDINEDATLAFVATQAGSPNSRLTVIDIADPWNINVIGSTIVGGAPNSPGWGCSYRGGYCYVGGGGRLLVVDVRVPTAPVLVGSAGSTLGNPTVYGTLPLRSHHVFACNPFNDRLQVWNVSDPANPTTGWTGSSVASSISLDGARDVVLDDHGNFAYVAAYDGSRVTVVQIT